MNKKGFIFVETIIVTAILLASLMVTYSLFTTSYSQENKRIRYDDASKLYQVYYLKRYFEAFNLGQIMSNNNIDESLFINVNCTGDTMSNEDRQMCDTMITNLHVNQILLMTYDLSKIIKCENTKSKIICDNIENKPLFDYLKSLDLPATAEKKYLFIVEFTETEAGDACKEANNPCFKSYAYVPIS